MATSGATRVSQADEEALAAFLGAWPDDTGLTVRTLVHAWGSGGGGIQVGNLAARLLGPGSQDKPPFTAGAVYAPRGDAHARLELCRVLLESHGVGHDQWVHWSDEFADLAHHGFDPEHRFPSLPITPDLPPPEVARLASGLRDLARMVGAPT